MNAETLASGREATRAPAEVQFRDIFAASQTMVSLRFLD